MSKDRVGQIRIEFAHSLVFIKPYLESDMNLKEQISDIITELRHDPNKEVIDAIESCEFRLLQSKKKMSKEEEKNDI